MCVCFTLSPLSAPPLSPVTHKARRHQGEDDGHKQEAHSRYHTSQQGLGDHLQEARTEGVHLHPCH